MDGKVNPIQMRQVAKITGTLNIYLKMSVDLTILRDKKPYFYQSLQNNYLINLDKRPELTEIPADKNNSIYDLFTPPLIYLNQNKLTTSLPDAPIEEEEREPFGVSILSFEMIPYRFRLASWIGKTPYIEDRKLTKEFGRTVRNRMEVNNSYKLIENPKPGRPSLVQVDANGSDKLLTLKYFTVQNVSQKNGGKASWSSID